MDFACRRNVTFQVSLDYSFPFGICNLFTVFTSPLVFTTIDESPSRSLRQKQAMSADTRVPVTVLTGYLGADTARP